MFDYKKYVFLCMYMTYYFLQNTDADVFNVSEEHND